MQLTEEQRKALLDEIDYNRKNCFLSDKTELLMQLAEAALTTEPVAALRLPDEILIHSEMDFVRKEKAKEWNRCLAEVKRLNTNQSQSHEVE